MQDNRFADLLEETLRSGTVPAGATPDEHSELEAAAAQVLAIRRKQAASDAEAQAAMPTARARFERFMAAERAHVPVVTHTAPRHRRGLFGGLLTPQRSVAGLAAGLVLVALVALFAGQLTGNGDVAAAQVLTPGGYVQLEGVVEQATGGDGTIVIRSALGDVTLELGETSVVAGGEASSVDRLQAGDTVVVSGQVSEVGNSGRPRVVAHTIAVATDGGHIIERRDVRKLKSFQADITGRILTFVVGPEGRGAALIETANGRRLLVPVEQQSAERLLTLTSLLGSRVEVRPAPGAPQGVFSLELVATGTNGDATPGPADGGAGGREGRPRPVHVGGIIRGRSGVLLDVVTDRGPATVRIDPHTRVLLSESGIGLADFAAGQPAVGHTVSIIGGIDRATGQVTADVIVVGPKPPARQTTP